MVLASGDGEGVFAQVFVWFLVIDNCLSGGVGAGPVRKGGNGMHYHNVDKTNG